MLKQVSDFVIVGENAHFLAANEEFVWKIIVTPQPLGALTRERSTAIASAPLYADVLMRVADANLSKLDAILDETVWVLQSDVEDWLSGQSRRWKRRAARDTGRVKRNTIPQHPATLPSY